MDIMRDLWVAFSSEERRKPLKENLCPTYPGGGRGGDVGGEERKNLEAPFEFQRRQTDLKRLYEVRSGKIGKSSTQQLKAQFWSQTELGSNPDYTNHLGDLQW